MLADACQPEAPFLHEAYVFGELLDGDDPLDHVKVARREHRDNDRYPENELWEAVDAYLDLLDHEPGSAEENDVARLRRPVLVCAWRIELRMDAVAVTDSRTCERSS